MGQLIIWHFEAASELIIAARGVDAIQNRMKACKVPRAAATGHVHVNVLGSSTSTSTSNSNCNRNGQQRTDLIR